jgi:hypothetical protein
MQVCYWGEQIKNEKNAKLTGHNMEISYEHY